MAATGRLLRLALLHTGLALLGSLLLFDLALALLGRPHLQRLAALFLAGAGSIRWRCRKPGARQWPWRMCWTGRPRRNRWRFRRISRTGALAVFDALQALRRPLPALPVVHQGFLLAQHGMVCARLAACRSQTVFDGKTLVAGNLGALQVFVNGLAFPTDSLAFRGVIRRSHGHRRGGRRHLGTGQARP